MSVPGMRAFLGCTGGLVVTAWLLVLAVALHNLEEALLLPARTQTAGRWYFPVGTQEFRFAVIF